MKRKTIKAVDVSNNKLNKRITIKDNAQKKNIAEVASYILGSTVSRGKNNLSKTLTI